MSLARTGFKRPVYERTRSVLTPIPEHLRRNASMTPLLASLSAPIEKDNPLQHQGYMDIVRAMPCAHCGRPPRSQFCHSDEGKGMGIKSDCRQGWPGCPECHEAIGTNRIYPRHQRRALEAEMARQTRAQIEASGQWPKNLPKWTE
jgi:hypothetical protein